MKLIRFIIVFFASVYCQCGCSVSPEPSSVTEYFPSAEPADVGIEPDSLQGLVDLAQRYVHEDRIIGAEMLIIKDRRTVLHEVVGWSDREANIPLARNSIYRMRSMTKPFTGTAALMLIDSGRLQLTSRPSEFFPSWDNERCRLITVEQLLTHRSGFEQNGWPVPASSLSRLREIVDKCGEQGPQHPQGEQFIYSDVNSFTLGAIVAHIEGQPVEQFIQEQILEHIGLQDTHTAYHPDAAWAVRMNPTYRLDEDSGTWVKYWSPKQEQEFKYFRASGGLYSTVGDYARWLACWMDGTRLPETSTDRLLSQPLVDAALSAYGSDEIGEYGYHWGVHSNDPTTFGHSGSDGTLAIAVPSLDIIVLYFTQSRGEDTMSEWAKASWEALKPK
jgi:CubicO group peptidase (beta-lactamase class C family)